MRQNFYCGRSAVELRGDSTGLWISFAKRRKDAPSVGFVEKGTKVYDWENRQAFKLDLSEGLLLRKWLMESLEYWKKKENYKRSFIHKWQNGQNFLYLQVYTGKDDKGDKSYIVLRNIKVSEDSGEKSQINFIFGDEKDVLLFSEFLRAYPLLVWKQEWDENLNRTSTETESGSGSDEGDDIDFEEDIPF
ncbi:hypothetical protein DRN58_01965 [Thermococci archaeon]|nr:MAG: hypothetical protein DRN58_01965 [Thermococci archaeon]